MDDVNELVEQLSKQGFKDEDSSCFDDSSSDEEDEGDFDLGEEDEDDEEMMMRQMEVQYDGHWLVEGIRFAMPNILEDDFEIDQEEDYQDDVGEGWASADREKEFVSLPFTGTGTPSEDIQKRIIETVERCAAKGLRIASGVIEYAIKGIAPQCLRISRMDDDDFEKLLSLKKRGNALFSKKRYKKAIEAYENALGHIGTRNYYVAPANQMEELVAILSNQAECHLRLKDYDEAGQVATNALTLINGHEKSRIRRAKADLALYQSESGRKISNLVQAQCDLESVLEDEHSSAAAKKSADQMMKDVDRLMEKEKIQSYGKDPKCDFPFLIRMLRATCWY